MKPLKFSFETRYYYLEFNQYPIIQLKGDSAVGKSLLVSDFLYAREINTELQNSLVINTWQREGLDALELNTYDYVIIDNADILLNKSMDEYIFSQVIRSNDTKYIIIGRAEFGCTVTINSIGKFEKKYDRKTGKTYFYVNYDIII